MDAFWQLCHLSLHLKWRICEEVCLHAIRVILVDCVSVLLDFRLWFGFRRVGPKLRMAFLRDTAFMDVAFVSLTCVS